MIGGPEMKKFTFQKPLSLRIKYEGLLWLRLQKRCMFVATEVGSYNADIFGINEKHGFEIEIKVSMVDFKNDFKKRKHYAYDRDGSMGISWGRRWIPNYFYFAVPTHMVEPVIAFLNDRSQFSHNRGPCEKYGVIGVGEGVWTFAKRAQKLHDHPPDTRMKAQMALRMGSELIRFHEAWL